MTISRIRVPSTYRDERGFPVHRTAEFKLGPGPCGETVDQLDCIVDTRSNVTICQRHTSGSRKMFHYPAHTLTGRVEVEHAAHN